MPVMAETKTEEGEYLLVKWFNRPSTRQILKMLMLLRTKSAGSEFHKKKKEWTRKFYYSIF